MRLCKGTVATLNGASASVAGFQLRSWATVNTGLTGMAGISGLTPTHFKVIASRCAAKSDAVRFSAKNLTSPTKPMRYRMELSRLPNFKGKLVPAKFPLGMVAVTSVSLSESQIVSTPVAAS